MKEYEMSRDEALKFDAKVEKDINNHLNLKWNRKCEYCNCDNDSIKSHAISQKISLEKICYDNHLIHPVSKRIGETEKDFYFEKISSEEATRFKGFCKLHDNKLFNKLDEFENRRSKYEIILQSYRSICFALYQSECGLIYLEESKNFTEKNFNCDFFRSHLSEESEQIDDKTFMEVAEDAKNKYNLEMCIFTEEFKILEKYKLEIEKLILKGAMSFKEYDENSFLTKDSVILEENNMVILYKRLDFFIPVALLNYHVNIIESEKNILLFTVIPYEDHSDIYWIFEKRYIQIYLKKWVEMLSSKINIINRIERSMTIAPHWYINPKVIKDIPKKRLEIIKNDLFYDFDQVVFSDYDVSIFDYLRKLLIEDMPEEIKLREKNKLNNNISRLSLEERKKEFMNKFKQIFLDDNLNNNEIK